MTDPNYTALMLVIDRSGSMASIRDDMVGGLTTMLDQQAAEPGRLTIDVTTFDDQIEHVHTLATRDQVVVELEPRGSTALFDAIGISVSRFGATLAAMEEHDRPDTVQVIVVTDGHENSSGEYTAAGVRALVTRQSTTYGWDFVFLGANQDAVLTGAQLGFDADSSLTYATDAFAVSSANDSLNRYVSSVRSKKKEGFTPTERAGAAPTP